MAKSTKSTSSNTRGSKKTAGRSAARKGAAKKRGAGSGTRTQAKSARGQSSTKRSAGQRAKPAAENWAASVGSLLGTQLGREILADVLDAAAGVLRRNRELAQSVADSGEAALESGREMATAAFTASTNVAGDVASAARDMAQTAAGALADLTTEAMRTMVPGGEEKRGNRDRSEPSRTGEADRDR
jgi:hypothetical protein